MKKNVINLNNGNVEEKEIIVKQTSAYKIKGFDNKGRSNFQLSKQLEYQNTIVYDIETVQIGVDYNKLHKFQTLDLSNNILYSYSLLIPKTFKKNVEILKRRYGKNYINEEKREVLNIEEKEDYFLFYYANDLNTSKSLNMLIECLYLLGKKSHTKKETHLKIIGFNNNKFDDLIFKHIHDCNIFTDTKNKINKLIIPLFNTSLRITSYDSKDLSKNFGAFNLSALGKQVGLEKLEIADEKNKNFVDMVNTNILYNNRDNEIVYKFIKFMNEEMGIYQTNVAGWTRKYFYSKVFDKLKIDSITVDKKINRFKLFGGRTEAYSYLQTKDIKYIDYNSLYTSSAVCLDMATGTRRMEYEKEVYDFNLTNVIATQDFQELLIMTEQFLMNNSKFSYVDLAKQYTSNYFYMGKFKITGINPYFIDKVELIEFFFPFVSKIQEKSSFSFDTDIIYEISFYEILFLALFTYEIVELYAVDKGEDILKEEKIKIYEDRKILKEQGNKLEKLEKLKLNSGYGIFATKNIENQIILDTRQIKTLDDITANFENKDKKEVWEFMKSKNYMFSFGIDTFDIKNIGDNYYTVKEISGQKWTGNSIPIIGLNIVSNARFMMYCIYLDYILNMKASLKNIEIYYTDTDSLFCSQRVFDRLKEVNLVGNELGQLKDEYPNDTITKLECFAPKTYEYTLNNETTKRVFKGTGTELNKLIISQSVKMKYSEINRDALNPEKIQKRVLEGNLFINKFGISKDLITHWEDFKSRN
jgi:hypothetical protein